MRIKNMKVSGIKNLDNQYIEFSNKNIQSDKESVVKLLYGNCGSGKTAILNAVDIYIGVISKYEFLKIYNSYLKSISSNNIIRFEVELLINKSSIIHMIEMRIHNNEFVIYYEKVIMGKKIYYLYEKNNLIMNLIITDVYIFNNKTSVFSYYFDMGYVWEHKGSISDKFKFGRYGFYKPGFSKILGSSYEILSEKELLMKPINGKRIIDSSTEIIENPHQEIYIPTLYEELFDAGVIESFFKLMNKNIVSVNLYREELGNNMCHEDILIKYTNREIYLSDESPGMKKILELFLAIHRSSGNIIILDDFDTYLSEKQSQLLLEYLIEYNSSQIIAVTQSTHLMTIVKKIPKSISIMDNGCVNTWRKNGNENPAKMFLGNKFVDETIDDQKMEEFFTSMKNNYDKWSGLQPQLVIRK